MKTTPATWMSLRLMRFAAAAGLLCACSSCASRGNLELLESQLRTQETLIQGYERQLGQLRNELTASQREMDLMRSDLAQASTLPQEAAQTLAKAQGLTFNSLLTAAQNRDDRPGDECFHAVIYPHDAHGELVKLSGKLEIEALDLSRPPQDKVIGHWEFSPEEARNLWHAGFLASGYQVDLPWQQSPAGGKVLLHARLTAFDGRQFEASHTLTLQPPAESGEPLELAVGSPKPWGGPPQRSVQQASFVSANAESPAKSTVATEQSAPVGRAALNAAPGALPEVVAEELAVGPREFPSDLQTSDNWTDETIPAWR